MAAFATEISRQNKQYFHGSVEPDLKAKVNHETKNILVPRFFDMETEIDTLSIREAFKRKKRKYIGLLPILGGGVPPDQYISGFFLRKKHL